MNFDLDEDLETVRDLAAEIFTDYATTERVGTVEASEHRVDEDLWGELARTGLLGLALPEEFDGAGLGMGALSVVLTEQGHGVAPIPLWSSMVAALAVAEHGTGEQRQALLPGVVDGSRRLTLALEEFGPEAPDEPACLAEPDGDGWLLSGTKAAVPDPRGARHVLVSASTPEGAGLFLVDTAAAGVRWERAETTSRQWSAHLTLNVAAALRIGASGAGVLRWVIQRASLALAALQLGVAGGALRQASEYLGQRHQFGRPLATFQAVAHQLADCYTDLECMAVTLWEAVWHLDDGEPATRATLVAKWWATEAGQRVVHRVQHLHGGIGVDIDYPVHRHFLWGKQIAGTLGGPSADLARLGAQLADEPVVTS